MKKNTPTKKTPTSDENCLQYCSGGKCDVTRHHSLGIVVRIPLPCRCKQQLGLAGAAHEVIIKTFSSTSQLSENGTYELPELQEAELADIWGHEDWADLDVHFACDVCRTEKYSEISEHVVSWYLPEREKWVVTCGGRCKAELPFGWTGPNRTGRIVVPGIHEFDPYKVYPEPRFADKWMSINWKAASHYFGLGS